MITATKIFISQKLSKTRQTMKNKHDTKYSASIMSYMRSAQPFAACVCELGVPSVQRIKTLTSGNDNNL